MSRNILYASYISTILGHMIAVSGNEKLYLLRFTDSFGTSRSLEKLSLTQNSQIIFKNTEFMKLVVSELSLYFKGTLKKFQIPMMLIGTDWQKRAWQELMNIDYGTTESYLEQSSRLGSKKSYRAIGNANKANNIAIIIPCHRVINNNGELGGYAGGIKRKEWLIEHEKTYG